MEPFTIDKLDNDELLAEALVILDSVDVDQLGSVAIASTLENLEAPEEKAAADDLLKTAIEAVDATFTRNLPEQKMSTTVEKHQIDECADVDNQPSRAPLHVMTAANNIDNATPKRTRNGGGRTRLREQLIQLRSVVQKMESYLETLRSPRSPRLDTQAEFGEDKESVRNLVGDENDNSKQNVPESASEVTDEAAVWRNIAMQQFRARRQAEQQNAELRANLAAQIRLSKQVENLLQAQPPHPVSRILILPD
ncbi:hypothetical protein PHMEG_0009535 [Phytophthora megakarya]|uniref:Uncharacterized protein n=1 Tax=Phytophthora megakarya TaxID=4795 RepID=A0A225WHE2_9STRA|nr:hypothetical protein PHMEG_0009535 [Phytophthora megakarya]